MNRVLRWWWAAVPALLVLVAVLPVANGTGTPAFRHDWLWPAMRQQCSGFSMLGMMPWRLTGLGSNAAYPQPWLPYLTGGTLCGAFGPQGGLVAFLAAILLAAGYGALWLGRRILRLPLWLSAVFALFYTANPVTMNEAQAGHLFFLWSYALLPFAFAIAWNRRSPWHGFLLGIVLGVASAQQQFIVFAPIVAAIAVCARLKRWDWRYALAALAAFAAVIAPQVYFGLRLSAHESTLLVNNLHWETAQSAHFADAVRFTGYIGHYDNVLTPLERWWFSIVALLAVAGAAVVRTRLAYLFAATYVLCATVLWGLYGPAAIPLAWLFTHLPSAAAFRELYSAGAPGAFAESTLVVMLLGVAAAGRRFRVASYAAAALGAFASVAIVARMFAGIPRYAPAEEELHIASRLASQPAPSRFLTVPVVQPQSGSDPAGRGVSPWVIPLGNAYDASVPQAPPQVVLTAKLSGNAALLSRLGIADVVTLQGVRTNIDLEPALAAFASGAATGFETASGDERTGAALVEVLPYSAGRGTVASPYAGARTLEPFAAVTSPVDLARDAGYDPRTQWAPLALFPGLPAWLFAVPSPIVTVERAPPLPFTGAAYVVAASDRGTLDGGGCTTLQRIDEHFSVARCAAGARLAGGAPYALSAAARSVRFSTPAAQSGATGSVAVLEAQPWWWHLSVRAPTGSALVLRTSFDDGWECDGCGTSRHVQVDGYANAWVSAHPVNGTVYLNYRPATAYFGMLAASMLLTAALAAWVLKMLFAAIRPIMNGARRGDELA